eukprot:scaffold2059_cov21-Tisochrysis_lutea.AAC.1
MLRFTTDFGPSCITLHRHKVACADRLLCATCAKLLHLYAGCVALVEQAMQVEGQRIPNSTHPSVPLGGEENATLLACIGEQRVFEGFQPADHVKLAESLQMVDFDA